MKKLVLSMVMCSALLASSAVMAQDKKTTEPAKKECSSSDKKKCCSSDKKKEASKTSDKQESTTKAAKSK